MKPEKDDWPYLYHWAPSDRRSSIARLGLCPHRLSRDRVWRPPHICLATSIEYAWLLSGGSNHNRLDNDVMWDLWEVWTGSIKRWEILNLTNGIDRELRVFNRIYAKDVHLVAVRTSNLYSRSPKSI